MKEEGLVVGEEESDVMARCVFRGLAFYYHERRIRLDGLPHNCGHRCHVNIYALEAVTQEAEVEIQLNRIPSEAIHPPRPCNKLRTYDNRSDNTTTRKNVEASPPYLCHPFSIHYCYYFID
jgi:hypothetical protein